MAVELYINGVSVDLSGGEAISIDYGVSEFSKIASRKGAVSAQFKLPITAKNVSVFKNPVNANPTGSAPVYNRLTARLLVDGVDQGITFCTLESTNDFYNIRLYGKESDFFARIKNKRIAELDLKHLDYFHTYNNVADLRTSTDVCFPVIYNFGEDSTENPNDVKYMPPGISLEFLMQKICEEQGYTLYNKVAETYQYPGQFLCFPFTKSEWVRNRDGSKYEASLEGNDFRVVSANRYDIKFETLTSVNNSNLWTANWGGFFFFPDAITATFNVSIPITTNSGFDPADAVTVGVYVNNSPATAENIYLPSTGAHTLTFTHTVSMSPSAANNNACFVWIYYEYPPSTAGVTFVGPATVDITDVVVDNTPEVIRDFDVLSSQYVTIDTVIPDISQANVFKAYCQIFCAIIQVDEVNKGVVITQFNDVANNISKLVDWSNKIDLTTPVEIKTDPGEYGQETVFDWLYDGTLLNLAPNNETYAKGTIAIQDTNLPSSKVAVEMDFAATKSTQKNGYQYCTIHVFKDDYSYLSESEDRIVWVKFADAPFDYEDGPSLSVTKTTDIPFTYFIKTGDRFNLGFGDSLLRYQYVQFVNTLQNFKGATVSVRLNAADIQTIDFTKPVYIEYLNGYFYISAIKNYTPGANNSTTVELVKLF